MSLNHNHNLRRWEIEERCRAQQANEEAHYRYRLGTDTIRLGGGLSSASIPRAVSSKNEEELLLLL